MRLRRVAVAMVVAGAAAMVVTGPGVFAQGGGTPANKVVAAGSKRVVMGPGTEVPLMSATMKTSKPTDLMIHTALECTILTQLTTNSANPTSTARNSVRVWIEIDGKVVPIEQISSPPQNGTTPEVGNKVTDGATFCERTYSRSVTDQENPADGQDQESDYIRTKAAHAFNWVKMNVGSGLHTITVKADLVPGPMAGSASTEAEIGNRTLIVEPTKMANSAVIAENGTGNSGR